MVLIVDRKLWVWLQIYFFQRWFLSWWTHIQRIWLLFDSWMRRCSIDNVFDFRMPLQDIVEGIFRQDVGDNLKNQISIRYFSLRFFSRFKNLTSDLDVPVTLYPLANNLTTLCCAMNPVAPVKYSRACYICDWCRLASRLNLHFR